MPVPKGSGSNSDFVRMVKSMGGGSKGSAASQDVVFMGTKTSLQSKGGRADAYVRRTQPRYETVAEATNDFFQWGEKKRKDFMSQAIIGGLLKEGDGIMEASRMWALLVKESAAYTGAGKDFTPWDVMAAYTKQAGGANAWVRQGDWEVNTVTGERRYVGPRFKTTTDQRVDFTDPATARAIATGVFQDMLGRDPGKGELEAFASALSKAEQAHPVVTRTTTEYNDQGEAIGTNSQQRGGLTAAGRQMIEQNKIKKDDEYGAYQAATTYQNALESLVYGSPG